MPQNESATAGQPDVSTAAVAQIPFDMPHKKQSAVDRAATAYRAQLLAEAHELLTELYDKTAQEASVAATNDDDAQIRIDRGSRAAIRVMEIAIANAERPDPRAKDAWTSIYDLERALIAALPPSRLERRAWIIRNRYREVAGAAKFAIYDASRPQPKDGTTIDTDTLRADLLELHRELVREYIFASAIEAQRATMSHRIAVMTLFLFFAVMLLFILAFIAPLIRAWFLGFALIGLAIWIFWGYRGQISTGAQALVLALTLAWFAPGAANAQARAPGPPVASEVTATPLRAFPSASQPTKTPASVGERITTALATPSDFPFDGLLTFLLVAFAGFMGGAFSVVRRLQTPTSDGDAALNLQGLTAGEANVTLAPLSGAIAGLVLYLFFCGKLVQGTLFPTIFSPEAKTPASFTSFITLLQTTGPQSAFDLAKVLVWCFVAGFAERLVPDAIDRLTSAAQKAGK